MTPGSCGSINVARLLDYGERLDRFAAFAAAACEVPADARRWGAP
jgi:hypothetical protein